MWSAFHIFNFWNDLGQSQQLSVTIFLRLAAVEAVYRTDFQGVCFVVFVDSNEKWKRWDLSGVIILTTDVKLELKVILFEPPMNHLKKQNSWELPPDWRELVCDTVAAL